ncbi:hypothetical protein [Polymorphospora sp. NPDC050346]|uniref:hypothetical protein n=1 Tax=Polymorphospora sp. NPDC050346 TaxID=3155780 RepID=UPI0033E4F48A
MADGAAATEPARVRIDADDRTVEFGEDELVVLPEQTADDTDRGWGERPGSNDDRLLAERPPHYGD